MAINLLLRGVVRARNSFMWKSTFAVGVSLERERGTKNRLEGGGT